MGYDMQGEMEDESEQVMALRALTDAITALDKRFRALNDSIEALEKRMDEASIAKALEVEKNKTAALRSSGREDAAAFFAQVAERVARSL
jgi:TolA-binding protein